MNRILVFDGNNLAHRVRHSQRMLVSSSGSRTGVLYGTLRSYLSILDVLTPTVSIFAWDYGLSPRRLLAYPDYKANRRQSREKYTPEEEASYEDFKRQMDDARQVLSFIGVHNVQVGDMEADDIAALTCMMAEHGHLKLGNYHIYIVTSDKDYYQLVSDKVSLLMPKVKASGYDTVTPANFKKMTVRKDTPLGFPSPGAYLVFHTLHGDEGDNIPPVPGAGLKTTLALLEKFDWPTTITELTEKVRKLTDKELAQLPGRCKSLVLSLRTKEGMEAVVRNSALVDLKLILAPGDKSYWEPLGDVYTALVNAVQQFNPDIQSAVRILEENDIYSVDTAILKRYTSTVRELREVAR